LGLFRKNEAAVLYHSLTPAIAWSEIDALKRDYGPKGAGLAALPRPWTLPFVLIPASITSGVSDLLKVLPSDFPAKVRELARATGKVIVRSSVIGETIWHRGKYKSVVIEIGDAPNEALITEACKEVLESAEGKPTALVVQTYLESRERGEFGNLLRISKTRDQWELTTHTADGAVTSLRFNTQRDPAASDVSPLSVKPRLSRERLFGSIAAWFNNTPMRGRSTRVNCEWVSDNKNFYLVQVDEEDEDVLGINPFQVLIEPAHEPEAVSGAVLRAADQSAMARWDKLKVLEELWGESTEHRPNLFYVPLTDVPAPSDQERIRALAGDFENLLGPNNIVVRTSGEQGQPKGTNLLRTDCLTPLRAAEWCVAQKEQLIASGGDAGKMAFVMHRYIAARASAWARADPSDPTVEIHGLWGLPDALQYCPYDIWEVHVPTNSATDYPDYKSNMLIAQADGSWNYVRIKNEIARGRSVPHRDALEVALRTHAIAQRLGVACHVMWFIGCVDNEDKTFNIPWYWVPAYPTEKNEDRSRHLSFVVTGRESLEQLKSSNPDGSRLMLVLRPDQPSLFRDNDFVTEVAQVAQECGLPIVLEGSTLAHAYYLLVRAGCTVIGRGEKDYSRVRKSVPLGKIVRDKIPDRIAARQELEVSTEIPITTRQAFLIGKILEEALEVRETQSRDDRKVELADLLEIVRALAQMGGYSLSDVISAADVKREKLGGFDHGKVLLQTGIGGPGQTAMQPNSSSAQVLSRHTSADVSEIPFTFFGFAEIEQPRSISFPDFGVSVELTLKSDRLVLRIVREPEQLELPLSLEIGSSEPQ
jgi:predicted house-cleaning noncanonical NTP pyrophosphatase (MazG superfamily)